MTAHHEVATFGTESSDTLAVNMNTAYALPPLRTTSMVALVTISGIFGPWIGVAPLVIIEPGGVFQLVPFVYIIGLLPALVGSAIFARLYPWDDPLPPGQSAGLGALSGVLACFVIGVLGCVFGLLSGYPGDGFKFFLFTAFFVSLFAILAGAVLGALTSVCVRTRGA